MINGLARRGVPLLLVVLPDGSRSLIPSAWTDWLGSCGIDAPGEVKDGEDLCAVGDLIKARAVIDALLSRLAESAPGEEGDHAAGVGVSRRARGAGGPDEGALGIRSIRRPRSQRWTSSRVSSRRCSRPAQRWRQVMSDIQKITSSHLTRVAVVYLRQSSSAQVEHNRKSTDRQYALAHSFSVRDQGPAKGAHDFGQSSAKSPKWVRFAHKEAREQRKSRAPGEALRDFDDPRSISPLVDANGHLPAGATRIARHFAAESVHCRRHDRFGVQQ